MTLACKAENSFATVPAPKTLDATIDRVRKEFQIEAPGADLLYSHPYEVLTEQVTAGRYLGREIVDGVEANHLAFEGDQVDWQISDPGGLPAAAGAIRHHDQRVEVPARIHGAAVQLGARRQGSSHNVHVRGPERRAARPDLPGALPSGPQQAAAPPQ